MGDWTPVEEARWNEAEAITTDLIDRGYVCGHPDRGDVFATVRALLAAGYAMAASGSSAAVTHE